MYNSNIKRQYVEHVVLATESQNIDHYRSGLLSQFKRTEPLEKEFGKDILNMSQEELKLFFSKFLKGGRGYRYHSLLMIKLYCEWGVQKNYSTIDLSWLRDLKLSDIETSQTYCDKMVSSEEELISCICQKLDNINRDTQDNIIRCICLLLYSGVLYDDIWHLRETDVDLTTRTINYKDKRISMSDALYEIVSHNMKMDQLLIMGRETEFLRGIIKEGYLISNTKEYGKDRNKMKRTYASAISNVFSGNEIKDLTIRSIFESGVFRRIYLNEKKTGEIDCSEYLWARRTSAPVINYPHKVKEKCKYEYDIWKKSFDLT